MPELALDAFRLARDEEQPRADPVRPPRRPSPARRRRDDIAVLKLVSPNFVAVLQEHRFEGWTTIPVLWTSAAATMSSGVYTRRRPLRRSCRDT
jgi:hypothetical protein